MEVRILASDDDHQVLGDDYCTGYADQYGKWNTGFYCPTKSNDEAVYCCGTQTYKYCCTRRSQAIQSHTNHPTRHQLDPRILLKIIGLTCIVSVFLTILTCYVCKRYWKRSDTRDNHVYRVACTTSSSPHVFPLESFQPLNPNAFLKSPEHAANFCGDISLISSQQQPQYRLIASTRPSAALCSFQHHSLSRQQRNHEPPPPYQLSVLSNNVNAAASSGQCGSWTTRNQQAVTDPKQLEAATTATTQVKSLSPHNSNDQTSAQSGGKETHCAKAKYSWRRRSQ